MINIKRSSNIKDIKNQLLTFVNPTIITIATTVRLINVKTLFNTALSLMQMTSKNIKKRKKKKTNEQIIKQ